MCVGRKSDLDSKIVSLRINGSHWIVFDHEMIDLLLFLEIKFDLKVT